MTTLKSFAGLTTELTLETIKSFAKRVENYLLEPKGYINPCEYIDNLPSSPSDYIFSHHAHKALREEGVNCPPGGDYAIFVELACRGFNTLNDKVSWSDVVDTAIHLQPEFRRWYTPYTHECVYDRTNSKLVVVESNGSHEPTSPFQGDYETMKKVSSLEVIDYSDGEIRIKALNGEIVNPCCNVKSKETHSLYELKNYFIEHGEKDRHGWYIIRNELGGWGYNPTDNKELRMFHHFDSEIKSFYISSIDNPETGYVEDGILCQGIDGEIYTEYPEGYTATEQFSACPDSKNVSVTVYGADTLYSLIVKGELTEELKVLNTIK